MANYINITLDNTGVTPKSVKINGDETRTTSTAVTLQITLNEADAQFADTYEMAIFGSVVGAEDERNLNWEKFSFEKNITLTDGDGEKIVYVILRDDLHNEGSEVYDEITLYTEVPTVNVSGPTIGRISNNEGKNITTFTFTADKSITNCKVMVVENINVRHDDATNKLLAATNGSKMTVDINGETVDCSGDYLEFDLTELPLMSLGGKEFTVTINGIDLYYLSPADGVKIIKVFVKEKNGNWSV